MKKADLDAHPQILHSILINRLTLSERTEFNVWNDARWRKNPSIKVTWTGSQAGHEAALSTSGR